MRSNDEKPARRRNERPARRERRPQPEPDPVNLQAAALSHLARYAATQAGLAQVLQRRVDRWSREAGGEADAKAVVVARARAAIAALVQRLAESGAVSDQAFAQSRARSLARAGRSRRAIGAHLSNKGVPGELARESTVDDPEQELAAALIHARKRRLGPWRKLAESPELRRRELANMARAGFPSAVAVRALKLEREEAEARIIRFRADL